MTREPDITGIGSAYLIKHPEGRLREAPSHVSSVLINGPWHPAWNWWLLYVVDLEDRPGVAPPVKHYDEAEYEFAIWSLNPRTPVDVEAFEAGEGHGVLEPADAVVQFHGVSREDAARLVESVAGLIVAGHASPDSDYRSWWTECIENSVRHMRGEPHAPPGGGR